MRSERRSYTAGMCEQDRPSRAQYLSFDSPQSEAPLLMVNSPSTTPLLSRRDRWIGYFILSGLVIGLGIGFVVLIYPPAIVDVRRFLPLLAMIGFLATTAGFWWLWWRPR